MQGAVHNYLKMALVVGCFVMFCVQQFLSLTASSLGKEWGLYKAGTPGSVSSNFTLDITPTGATFSIWGLIYIWQAAWLIYSLTLICRKYSGGYLYIDPPVIPLPVYGIYILNLCLIIGWSFLYDREEIIAACVFLFSISFTLYAIIFIFIRRFDYTASILYTDGKGLEVWFLRIFLHNGIAIYAAWCTVASLLNLGQCLIFYGGLSQTTGCAVCLGILTAEVIAIFVFENFIFEKQFRYISAQYITLMAGTIGGYVKNSATASQTISTWLTVLMSLVIVCFVFKMIRSIFMHFKHPIVFGTSSMMSDVRLSNSRQVLTEA